MRKSFIPIAAVAALPLAACAMSPYGTGYGYGPNSTYSTIGVLGGAYGASLSQAGASACANHASRFGPATVRNVRTLDRAHVKVFGYVHRGYRTEGWDCTFRADGRITDFDL